MSVREGYKQTEIGVIPEEWEVVNLSDIANVNMGQSPKSATYNEEGIGLPLVQGNADCKNRKTEPRIFTSEPTKTCSIGDIIMTVRAPVGAIVKSHHNACIGRGVCAITAKENEAFLYQLLIDYEDKWEKLSQGSTFTAVNGTDVKSIKLPKPPLPEQQKIAAILTIVDNKIEVIDEQLAKTEQLKKGLIQKLLSEGIGHSEFKESEIGRIPKEWEVVKVGDITASHKQGYYTKDEYTNEGVYLIRITDLNNPKIDYSNMPKLLVSDTDYASFKVNRGDFLFARSGAIGRYGIVYENYKAIFASYLIRFTFRRDKIVNEYFGYFYETKKAINQLLSITQGSSNININANNIKSLIIPLPPITEQKQIATILSTTDNKLDTLQEKKSRYEKLKKGLMQKLLMGEVRVKI